MSPGVPGGDGISAPNRGVMLSAADEATLAALYRTFVRTAAVPDVPLTAATDLRARYDSIVVGSGAGGCVAANVCANAGMSVLVLESGPPLETSANRSLDAGLMNPGGIAILAACAVGGGMSVRWPTLQQLPAPVARAWSESAGGIEFAEALAPHYEAVAKRSSLTGATLAGAQVVARARVEQVHIDATGRAHGVNVMFVYNGELMRRTIAAPRVILSAGALRTPGILRASGIETAHLGAHLRLHPAVAMLSGGSQEIHDFAGLDSSYGVRFETIAGLPENRALLIAFLHDRGEGNVASENGLEIRYRLSRSDASRLRMGIEKLAQAAGAKPFTRKRYAVFSAHQMGTARMHSDPQLGVVNSAAQVHGHPNIYVTDSSVFPLASGVAPALTIMALAHRTATSLVQRG